MLPLFFGVLTGVAALACRRLKIERGMSGIGPGDLKARLDPGGLGERDRKKLLTAGDFTDEVTLRFPEPWGVMELTGEQMLGPTPRMGYSLVRMNVILEA